MSRVPLSWLERWYGMRDRLLASPSFHAFAARSWLTRRIARQRARTIFDLCAGFVYSQILFACVEINLFETLRGGPLTLEALQQKLDLPHEGARRLVFAAVSLGLLQKRGRDAEGRDLFGLGQHGAALLGNAGALAMVRHHRLLYADLADPVALLRGRPEQTNLERYWAYARNPEKAEIPAGAVADYSELMAASQPLVSTDILDAYDFSRHRCLLDIGGGEGGFLVAAARRVPHLKLQLFDLPPVAERARAKLAEAGLAARAEAFGGDFAVDSLPRGADLISLVRVVHDHDDAVVAPLLRAIRAALPEGGTLIIGEPMSEAPGAEPMGDAYFGFYLLAMGSGQPRSPARLTTMLREAGFSHIRTLPTNRPMLAGVIVAK